MNQAFTAGKPVTGNDLIGRSNEINQIINYLKNNQSVVLIAPRRFGKTSVILEILNKFKTGFFTSYIDFFSIPTIRMLSEEISKSVLQNRKIDYIISNIKDKFSTIIHNIEFKQIIKDFEFILAFAQENKDETDLLKNSIEFFENFANKYNKKYIVAFDEFSDVTKFDGDDIVKLFRSIIQLQTQTNYIFSGSYESMMNNIFIKKNSPFYRFARIIELGFIDKVVFSDFLNTRFEARKISISQSAIDIILEITKGHPYYTQLIAQEISFNAERKINKNNIMNFIESAAWSERSYFENLWQEISKSKTLLPIIVSQAEGISPYKILDPKKINISRGLKKLQLMGIIYNKNGSWEFYDTLFKYWILKFVLKKYKTGYV